jgi:hypothetical protein
MCLMHCLFLLSHQRTSEERRDLLFSNLYICTLYVIVLKGDYIEYHCSEYNKHGSIYEYKLKIKSCMKRMKNIFIGITILRIYTRYTRIIFYKNIRQMRIDIAIYNDLYCVISCISI